MGKAGSQNGGSKGDFKILTGKSAEKNSRKAQEQMGGQYYNKS